MQKMGNNLLYQTRYPEAASKWVYVSTNTEHFYVADYTYHRQAGTLYHSLQYLVLETDHTIPCQASHIP